MNSRYSVGSVVLNNWKLTRVIGEGSFGQVFEAERADFSGVYHAAIKVVTVPKSQSEVQNIRANGMDDRSVTVYFRSMVEEMVSEFALMAKMKGESNIVSYEDHAVIPHEHEIGWDILIRMELLIPMLQYVQERPMSREDVIRLGIDLCHALELCKRHNIIHRDIKPGNIFVSPSGNFKLGDFGIARTIEKTTSGLSQKGTYTYMAPEVFRGLKYGSSVDQYSLGIVLYWLLNKFRTPFLPANPIPITHSDQETSLQRRMGGEEIAPPQDADGHLAAIVLKAISYDPENRYSSAALMRQDLEAALDGQVPAAYLESRQRAEQNVYPGGVRWGREDTYTQPLPGQQNAVPDSGGFGGQGQTGFGIAGQTGFGSGGQTLLIGHDQPGVSATPDYRPPDPAGRGGVPQGSQGWYDETSWRGQAPPVEPQRKQPAKPKERNLKLFLIIGGAVALVAVIIGLLAIPRLFPSKDEQPSEAGSSASSVSGIASHGVFAGLSQEGAGAGTSAADQTEPDDSGGGGETIVPAEKQEVTVHLECSAIESAALRAVGKPKGSLTPGDLSSVTELRLTKEDGSAIHSLRDLRYFPNLELLEVKGIPVTDTAGLDDAVQLQRLNLTNCGCTDGMIPDTLAGIQKLVLRENQLTSLDFTEKLEHLIYLDITDNPIRDLGPLAKAGNLEKLFASGTEVEDWSPVKHVASVEGRVVVTGVSPSALYLNVNNTGTLTAVISPADAENAKVSWSSSNAAVATVTGGRVKAVAAGSAVITARCGGYEAVCTISVQAAGTAPSTTPKPQQVNPEPPQDAIPVEAITLSNYGILLEVDKTFILNATVTPANATNKAVTWSSSNVSVASVSGGYVTANSPGQATIVAYCGGKSAACTVTVS